jgi:DNA-binding response OmpR family regulator
MIPLCGAVMGSRENILIVHGDQRKVSRINGALEKAGYEVTARYSAREGLKSLYETHPDLVIIEKEALLGEQGLPYLSIREEVYVPLISIGPDKQAVEVLEMGVDAYMGEPLSMRELLARIHAILRRKRHYRKHSGDNGSSAEHLDELLINAQELLTNTEFRLLSCLVMNSGGVLPYKRLLSDVWGRTICRDTLHQYVRRVKQKLEIDSVGPYRLLNYRGEGYCFCAGTVRVT